MGKEKNLGVGHISNSFSLTHNYPAEPVISHFLDSFKRKDAVVGKTLKDKSSVAGSERAPLVCP